MQLVVSLNEDGTAAVTTPIAQPGESDADALARVLAETPGGEPLSAELVAAIRRADQPAAGSLIDPHDFRERIAPAYFVVVDAVVRTKWDRIVADFLPPTRTQPINLASPITQLMVGAMVADQLLTQEQAAAVLAT